MIVQLAGLPGTGKSTLAAAIAGRLGLACLVLDKDRVRHALYGTAHTVYSRAQDDFVVRLLHQAAERHLAGRADATVILERTCTRAYQVTDAAALAARAGCPLALIECVCPDHVARERLARGRDDGHPAANRDFTLYQKLGRRGPDHRPRSPAAHRHADWRVRRPRPGLPGTGGGGNRPGQGEPLVTRPDLPALLEIAREAVSAAAGTCAPAPSARSPSKATATSLPTWTSPSSGVPAASCTSAPRPSGSSARRKAATPGRACAGSSTRSTAPPTSSAACP